MRMKRRIEKTTRRFWRQHASLLPRHHRWGRNPRPVPALPVRPGRASRSTRGGRGPWRGKGGGGSLRRPRSRTRSRNSPWQSHPSWMEGSDASWLRRRRRMPEGLGGVGVGVEGWDGDFGCKKLFPAFLVLLYSSSPCAPRRKWSPSSSTRPSLRPRPLGLPWRLPPRLRPVLLLELRPLPLPLPLRRRRRLCRR